MNSSQQSNQDDNDYASDADDDNDYSSSRLNEREDDDEDDGNDSDDDDEDDDRDGSLSTDKNTTVSTYSEHKSASFAESDAYKGRLVLDCFLCITFFFSCNEKIFKIKTLRSLYKRKQKKIYQYEAFVVRDNAS